MKMNETVMRVNKENEREKKNELMVWVFCSKDTLGNIKGKKKKKKKKKKTTRNNQTPPIALATSICLAHQPCLLGLMVMLVDWPY